MNDETKNYPETKVYYDGSHYIGIPQENYPHGKGSKRQSAAIPTPEQSERKAKFETAYRESQSLSGKDRKKYIAEKLQCEFETDEQAKEYTAQNLERKRNNAAKRYGDNITELYGTMPNRKRQRKNLKLFTQIVVRFRFFLGGAVVT